MAWNDDLDPASPAYAIASSPASRLRVLAGPGTGKSFALKRRVARLLEEEDIAPRHILPVTFTRVAAEDLHRELVSLHVEGANELHGRTLHSLALWVLRRHNVFEAIGRIPRPLNQFEIEPLLYDLSNDFGNKSNRKKRIQAFEAAWARLQDEEPGFTLDEIDQAFEQALVGWLTFHEGMLIGEIIPQVYRYLRDNPAAPEKQLFSSILVDEFQDLNKAEQRVIEMLAEECDLCVVGDDDQSIYSFKFANPEGIREWHEVHEDAVDLNLLECRRCPTRIVAMANSVISHNQDREERILMDMEENGEGVIHITQYNSLDEEIDGVSNLVRHLIFEEDVPPGDILILAQRRVIGTPIFEQLTENEVPVKSYYQESQLDSETAQERLSILKLFVNRDDKVSLRWLLGLGSNDFRTGAYHRIREYSDLHGLTPWGVVSGLAEEDISIPYTRQIVERFRDIENELAQLGGVLDLEDFIGTWLPDGVEELHELRAIAENCLHSCANESELLNEIVERITQPEIPLEVAEVRIMSLTRSKGLNSPIVIIAGCVEGLLPVRPDSDLPLPKRNAIIEEQRRLFFVGLTRVKAQPEFGKPGILYLTNSRIWPQADALGSGLRPHTIRHGLAHFNASRFLGELGPAAPQPIAG